MHGRGGLFFAAKTIFMSYTKFTTPPCIMDITCALLVTCLMLHDITIVVQRDVIVLCYMFMFV